MDLNQRKLTKAEWESIELSISQEEKKVLQLIIDGYGDVNIRVNHHLSLFGFLKIEYNELMEDYLYNKYFLKKIESMIKNMTQETEFISQYKKLNINTNINIKKADLIRLQKNTEETISKEDIYENVLLDNLEKLLNHFSASITDKSKRKEKKELKNNPFEFYYFTLYKLIQNNIEHLNRHILVIVKLVLKYYEEKMKISVILENAVEYIEKNTNLLKYADMTLYEHQKEIFTIFNQPSKSPENLVLYIAPTGTGKTLTPIALSQSHKIIFVCAARHVGISLARSAISMNKKIAFAFGCGSAEDIRLHYFAAKDYTKDWRTGGIRKVDNSVGEKVEIIICDIKSYLPAMYYMCSFNEKHNIITYWDEPTITMDYESHEIHEIIHKNWKENLIPNMVLSSATLPKLHELTDVIADFKEKFPYTNVHNIVSHDCKKSIPMVNNNGYVVLPHLLSDDYEEVKKIATNCENYLTLLRYFDLKEVVDFISYVAIRNNFISGKMAIERNFCSLDDLTMKNIKLYYLKIVKNIIGGTWGAVLTHLKINRKQRIIPNHYIDTKGNKVPQKSVSIGGALNNISGSKETIPNLHFNDGKSILRSMSDTSFMNQPSQNSSSGNCAVYVTTKDAYTLTDGPTIFLANDVEKIAKFYIQQANIPVLVMNEIMKKIEFNNSLNEKIDELERELEFMTEKGNSTSSLSSKDGHKLKKESRESSKDSTNNNNNTNSSTGGGVNKLNQMKEQIYSLKSMIRTVSLNDTFVPNKLHHLKKWAEEMNVKNAFTSNIEEDIVNEIMLLNGVEDNWKILLMMGIGVFSNVTGSGNGIETGEKRNGRYIEIMKRMADEQKLYIIIASSDYIYGTNYQFCHGYLSKDLNLTQEKIIQAMGRIGRSNVQQDYTIRFRDDEQIIKLFSEDTEKPEVNNMNRLLCSNRDTR